MVATVGTAEEGACSCGGPFDALLCDIGLPGEDGYSFIRRARALSETTRGMPALALSAFARDRDRQRVARSRLRRAPREARRPGRAASRLTALLPRAAAPGCRRRVRCSGGRADRLT